MIEKLSHRVTFSNKLSIIAVTETSFHFTRFSICANRVARVTSFFHRTYLAVKIGVSITNNNVLWWKLSVTRQKDSSNLSCDTLSAFPPLELSSGMIWSL